MKIAALLLLPLLLTSVRAGDLVVEVTGEKGMAGVVHVGLCKDMKTMKDFNKITLGKTIKLGKDGKARVSFRGLRKGEYALKIFLDQNGNSQLDTNVLGIPKEPYGLSNNVKPRFSMPKWDKLKFKVGKGKTVQKIQLRD